MGADNIRQLLSATTVTTATSVTASVDAPGSGKRVVVGGALGSSANAFSWQLKQNATVIAQGQGLAGADAGFAFDPFGGIAIAANNTCSFVITPSSGTVACMANIFYAITGPNE